MTVFVVQHLVKTPGGLKHKGHALIKVGQVCQHTAVKTDRASIVERLALAGKGQFDGLGDPRRETGDVRHMIAAQQPDHAGVFVQGRLQDVFLFVSGKEPHAQGYISVF